MLLMIQAEDGIAALRLINNEGPVTALAVDEINGCIISGSQDKIIRIFDMDRKDEVVQKNHGHSDEIRSIIHIPARNQVRSGLRFISIVCISIVGQYCSGMEWYFDTIKWNLTSTAYFKKGQRRIAISGNANAATHTFYDLDEVRCSNCKFIQKVCTYICRSQPTGSPQNASQRHLCQRHGPRTTGGRGRNAPGTCTYKYY